MIQVLHLHSGRRPAFAAARAAEAICRSADRDIEIVTRSIGRGGAYRNVVHAGLALRLGNWPGFDLIHVWDAASLAAAVASPAPVIFTPAAAPLPDATRSWLAKAMMYRQVHLVFNTAADAHAFAGRTDGPDRRVHVIAPAVDASRIRVPGDVALRAALGFGRDDFVVLAPGESTHGSGHGLAVHSVSILHVMNDRYRLLAWGRGPSARVVESWGSKLRQPRLVTMAERRLGCGVEFEELLAVADVALVAARRSSLATELATCMAAGLPIIATARASARELLEDGRTAVVAPTFHPRDLAQRLLELKEDPCRRQRLGDAARIESRRFDTARFVDRFRHLYRDIAGARAPTRMRPDKGDRQSSGTE